MSVLIVAFSASEHEKDAFKNVHSVERFQEVAFLVTKNASYVWTEGENG